MKTFDVLIVGGGAAGMSCALILGSAKDKGFAKGKKVGIILHQKASHLQDALFNNVLGLDPGTTGESILETGKNQLSELYPNIRQIDNEKVIEVQRLPNGFEVVTNKSVFHTKEIVIAVGYTNTFFIKGLEQFVEPHKKAKPEKNRIQLKNDDHLVVDGIYVAGTLAGWRSQFAIACGSGASVVTDILTQWNGGEHTKVHDKI
ncbi:FAD-dependent oxidoreductase [Aureibaculum luteum]|uniref:FAD-dependent oxidoreductase n=1 Tax=Aureibaculum luteum TaxID=1548456 RepID=UPI000E51E41D|nr:FAD-dependent oxidoreductase [Aureibaculum luteum]